MSRNNDKKQYYASGLQVDAQDYSFNGLERTYWERETGDTTSSLNKIMLEGLKGYFGEVTGSLTTLLRRFWDEVLTNPQRWYYNFDGENDYVQLDTAVTLEEDYVISFFVDYEDSSGEVGYVRPFGDSSDYISRMMIYNSGDIWWNPDDSGDRVETGEGTITPGQHFIKLTRTADIGIVEVDGVEVFVGTVPDGVAHIDVIGKQGDTVTGNCRIWDVRLGEDFFLPIDGGPGTTRPTDLSGTERGDHVNFNDENWTRGSVVESPVDAEANVPQALSDTTSIQNSSLFNDTGVLE